MVTGRGLPETSMWRGRYPASLEDSALRILTPERLSRIFSGTSSVPFLPPKREPSASENLCEVRLRSLKSFLRRLICHSPQ